MNTFMKRMIEALILLTVILTVTACGNKEATEAQNPEQGEDVGMVTTKVDKPWENGGKHVSEYTWEEFEELSTELKDAFFNAFESPEAFEEWKEHAEEDAQEPIDRPWENGGKSVSEYTWEEFEELSTELKDAFFNAFESTEAFEEWKEHAEDAQEPIDRPWENGGKGVSEYTWEEFEELSTELKDAFFNAFESSEAFEAWKEQAEEDAQEPIDRPWENGGKSVSEYTWEEFEELSMELKDAFFNAFESIEAFEAWMEKVQA